MSDPKSELKQPSTRRIFLRSIFWILGAVAVGVAALWVQSYLGFVALTYMSTASTPNGWRRYEFNTHWGTATMRVRSFWSSRVKREQIPVSLPRTPAPGHWLVEMRRYEVGRTWRQQPRWFGQLSLRHVSEQLPMNNGADVVSDHELTVPFWLVVLPFWSPLLVRWYFSRRARRVERLGRCAKCGFDLRASQDRCPECGTPIPVPASTQATPSSAP